MVTIDIRPLNRRRKSQAVTRIKCCLPCAYVEKNEGEEAAMIAGDFEILDECDADD